MESLHLATRSSGRMALILVCASEFVKNIENGVHIRHVTETRILTSSGLHGMIRRLHGKQLKEPLMSIPFW